MMNNYFVLLIYVFSSLLLDVHCTRFFIGKNKERCLVDDAHAHIISFGMYQIEPLLGVRNIIKVSINFSQNIYPAKESGRLFFLK